MRRATWWAVLLLWAAVMPACEDPGAPEDEGVDEAELTFLRFPPDLQPLLTTEGSFYAVKGEDRELVLRYQPEEPGEEGEEFLQFQVPDDALLRRPDGSLFAEGDSILITVSVDPDARFLFDFQPSGLEFDRDDAPTLEISYERLGGDVDGDGDVDSDDDDIEEDLGLWRQEAPGEPWFPVGSIQFDDLDEIEGEIFGFTGFAIAG